LPETILVSVFNSLLGISDINHNISDLGVEGAINLMNKVGENFENRVKNKDKKEHEFNTIVAKFQEY
jgi:hypothetical protein